MNVSPLLGNSNININLPISKCKDKKKSQHSNKICKVNKIFHHFFVFLHSLYDF